MRENKRGGALSKVQKLKKRLSQSFGKLGKKERGYSRESMPETWPCVLSIQMSNSESGNQMSAVEQRSRNSLQKDPIVFFPVPLANTSLINTSTHHVPHKAEIRRHDILSSV